MDQQPIGMLLHRPIECPFDLRFGAGIDDDDLDPDTATGSLEGLCISGVRILGIDQDCNDCRLGVHQPEQLDAFGSKLAIDESYAGDVATRPVEAGDQPMLDRVAAVCEHDRNARRRRLGGDRRDHAAGGKDHIDRKIGEVGRKGRQSLVLKIRPAIFDQEILLLDITGLVQASADGGCRRLYNQPPPRCREIRAPASALAAPAPRAARRGAPPRSVMNSRRFMGFPSLRPAAATLPHRRARTLLCMGESW